MDKAISTDDRREGFLVFVRLSKFVRLATRAYPDATFERLEIISDWITWLFVIDARCNESCLS